jgi:hypothetical protein
MKKILVANQKENPSSKSRRKKFKKKIKKKILVANQEENPSSKSRRKS